MNKHPLFFMLILSPLALGDEKVTAENVSLSQLYEATLTRNTDYVNEVADAFDRLKKSSKKPEMPLIIAHQFNKALELEAMRGDRCEPKIVDRLLKSGAIFELDDWTHILGAMDCPGLLVKVFSQNKDSASQVVAAFPLQAAITAKYDALVYQLKKILLLSKEKNGPQLASETAIKIEELGKLFFEMKAATQKVCDKNKKACDAVAKYDEFQKRAKEKSAEATRALEKDDKLPVEQKNSLKFIINGFYGPFLK